MYNYFWHYSFHGRLACCKVYKLMFLVLCALYVISLGIWEAESMKHH